jgi:glutamate-1-semialdehyde 2,1-aminomutase
MSERYRASEEMLERALRTVPLGTQTFSKSKTQYPYGVSPYFVTRGEGSRLWDVDGNEYVDFVMSLCAVTLGYSDPDVTAAVRAQLDDGVIFSLPHPLEVEVAERVIEMVPCAEMVRFGKNGSDATSGAVRLARAFSGRDRVAACGYHGWQDWYIGATPRNLGVPRATSDLTRLFAYNDLDSLARILREHRGEYACVIMEPMNATAPLPGFLEEVAALTRREGALFVFDETITGFRFANGGAQEYFGVVPDLATFGKGVANGYPISALAGRADVMRLLEEVFFSFTFGGEALSLAAAAATMDKLRREPVLATVAERGTRLVDRVRALIEKHDCGAFLRVSGHPAWSFLVIDDTDACTSYELKTLFEQEMFAAGFLTTGTHNMCYSHSESDVDGILGAYDALLPKMRDSVDNGALHNHLRCEPLVPLFKIR